MTAAQGGSAAGELLVRDVAVLDCTGREPEGRKDVVIRDGRIAAIEAAGTRATASNGASVDGAGMTLMPGLTDAHVHFAIIGDHGDHGDGDLITHVIRVAAFIDNALDEGFTTMRDAGGLDPAWARATEQGLIAGPRILPSGSVISQTGGHGDSRKQHEAVHGGGSIPGLVARNVVIDGVDEMMRAVREELRKGATQIKLLASGGIVSPTDPFESIQLSPEEIAAAVQVAQSWGTYVLAHCHTSPAIDIAIANGVRSVEHCSVLTPETAARMAKTGAFMVPTLQALDMLATYPERFSLPAEKVAKLRRISDAAFASVGVAREAGVRIASGSDVVGPWQGRRGEEIVLKARMMGVHDAILSATRTNAELFRMEDEIGTVEVGKRADLILIDGEPLKDVNVFGDPAKVRFVLKGGVVAKDSDGRAGAAWPTLRRGMPPASAILG